MALTVLPRVAALAAVEPAVLDRFPAGNGTGHHPSPHPLPHPQGNSYIERFHRSLKEEEVRVSEYQSLEEARQSSERSLWEYHHDRPHRSLGPRTPRQAFPVLAALSPDKF